MPNLMGVGRGCSMAPAPSTMRYDLLVRGID
jgi:hypothetical protein